MFGAPRSVWARMMQFVYQSHNLIQVRHVLYSCPYSRPSESTPLSLTCLSVIVHNSMVSPQS